MKNFWGYYENENYAVGCTGGSVYVYNRDGEELARFRDLTYAYTAKFMPGTNIIVVKTTEGHLAVYNLEQLQLVKKIFITGTGAQDHGFAFSRDVRDGEPVNEQSPARRIDFLALCEQVGDHHEVAVVLEPRVSLLLQHLELLQGRASVGHAQTCEIGRAHV